MIRCFSARYFCSRAGEMGRASVACERMLRAYANPDSPLPFPLPFGRDGVTVGVVGEALRERAGVEAELRDVVAVDTELAAGVRRDVVGDGRRSHVVELVVDRAVDGCDGARRIGDQVGVLDVDDRVLGVLGAEPFD